MRTGNANERSPGCRRRTPQLEPACAGPSQMTSRASQADAGTRTPDPLLTMEVLYQLSYVGAEGIVSLQDGPCLELSASLTGRGSCGIACRELDLCRSTRRGGATSRDAPPLAHDAAPRAPLLCLAARRSSSLPVVSAGAWRSSPSASRALAGSRTVWISRYASGAAYRPDHQRDVGAVCAVEPLGRCVQFGGERFDSPPDLSRGADLIEWSAVRVGQPPTTITHIP
jgi:hypothetical protein